MRIKLFYQKYKQALWDLESQVNGFIQITEQEKQHDIKNIFR
ncbi:Uncharacterised protein [Streptococcus pneumoniae]|nr:Uncharacterised protein [Streptococcus pneumoniae]VTB65376.1 Uncharacterised protein [Streptococcus pneumoniae]